MDTFGNTKSKINPRNILGGMGFFDDADFEKESAMVSAVATTVASTASQAVSGVFEAVLGLGQNIAGVEAKKETSGKFPTSGSIEFNRNQAQIEQLQKQQAKEDQQRTEAARQRAFFQALKEEQTRVQAEKDRVFEEEISDIITNLPTEQKNQLLHYQASYKDKSIYQRAELRKKIIEQRNNSEKQQKDSSIPSPAKQPSALEGAFEGGSGTQGSGTSNLSAQAVG